MIARERRKKHRGPLQSQAGRHSHHHRNRRVDKRKFNDQVIGRTMKTCRIELIVEVDPQMHILVMRHQCVDRNLRRHRQSKKPEKAGS